MEGISTIISINIFSRFNAIGSNHITHCFLCWCCVPYHNESFSSKRENVILIGIIPGPNEPKHDINTFLDPLVEELLLFWKGLNIMVATSGGKQEKVVSTNRFYCVLFYACLVTCPLHKKCVVFYHIVLH